jgi:hypothetical protein
MQPRTVAIYRLLYGSDFIRESLASVYDHVEQIICFVTHEVFGGRRVVKYFGRDVYFPHDIDGLTASIERWRAEHDHAGKVHILANPYGAELKGQVGRMVNELVLPRFDCSHLLFVEADEVWRADRLSHLMDVASRRDADEFMGTCKLFWRSPRFVSTRTNPYCVLRALKGRRQIGITGHALAETDPGLVRLADPGVVLHNFGYAASERTVFWKHLTGLSFSRDARLDSAPREDWFEASWRAWNWTTNRRTDLCPSVGHEGAFAPAAEYPFEDLPEEMQRRVREAPLAEWKSAEGPVDARRGAREGVAA